MIHTHTHTQFGLDGPGSNPGEGEFSALVQTGPGAHPASGGKERPESETDHTPPSSFRGLERLELYP
jgi:hypothetical protein